MWHAESGRVQPRLFGATLKSWRGPRNEGWRETVIVISGSNLKPQKISSVYDKKIQED
jgi:hypothetical protein